MIAASKLARARFRKMGDLIAAYVGKHKMPEEDKQLLRRLLGYAQPNDSLLACDLWLRYRVGKELGNILVEMRKANPGLKFYFWTIIHPRGNGFDRCPELDIRGMQSAADKVFRKFEMDGLSILEIQALTNWPQRGDGRLLMAHVHGVSWSERSFSCDAAMKLIAGSRGWPTVFGADPVDVREVADTDNDLRMIAHYMFKPPHDAKRVIKTDDRFRLRSTTGGYRPELAMRIIEGLSQLEFKSLIKSTAGGRAVKGDLLRRVVHRHKSRGDWRPGKIEAWSVNALWDRYRMKKRKREYSQFRFKR